MGRRSDGSSAAHEGGPGVFARVRQFVNTFAAAVPDTLPVPGSDQVPDAGRHARCAGDNGAQIYVRGQTFDRSLRGRIVARTAAAPAGWYLRLSLADCALVRLTSPASFSRADPQVLRAHRRMADPAFLSAIAAPLRAAFPARPVSVDRSSLFVNQGLMFVREASVSFPPPETAEESERLCAIVVALAAAFVGGSAAVAEPPAETTPERSVRRGHLRLVQ